MVESHFFGVYVYFVQALVFGVLSILLAKYYRSYRRPYVGFWGLSSAMLALNQLAFSLASYYYNGLTSSQVIVAIDVVLQVSRFMSTGFLFIGLWLVVKNRVISQRMILSLLFTMIAGGMLCALAFSFNDANVFNRFYMRESLPAFVVGCLLLAMSMVVISSRANHFSARLMTYYGLILGLRHVIYSFLSIVAITEDWLRELTNIVVIVDIGGNTVLGFIMLAWLQGSERHEAASAINRAKYLGQHDSLTGLLKREEVLQKLPKVMEAASKELQQLAVILIDIKRFKYINETYSLKIGDLVLEETANRLTQSLLKPKIVGRLSGNSFVFVVELYGISQQERAIEHIQSLIHQAYLIEQHKISVQCRIGYSLYPLQGELAEDLMKQANLALFHAQNHNLSSALFDQGMQLKGKRLLEMDADVRRALAEKEFVLHFQPQLNLISNRLEGVEALIRWQHPSKGLLSPIDFLPDIETLGLLSQIDNYVLECACQTIANWYKQYKRRVTIAVNITAVEFQNPKLTQKIQSLLLEYQIPPRCLELEITENIVITEVKTAMATIVTLQNMGIKVSIDDFGTGYSSLAYLRELPIDKIKIDRSFIKEVASNDSDLTIVKSMIELSHGLGKRVLAEGVETHEHLQTLRNLNCDAVQGYFISRPLPESDFVHYLNKK